MKSTPIIRLIPGIGHFDPPQFPLFLPDYLDDQASTALLDENTLLSQRGFGQNIFIIDAIPVRYWDARAANDTMPFRQAYHGKLKCWTEP
jgi:hypothetical protein